MDLFFPLLKYLIFFNTLLPRLLTVAAEYFIDQMSELLFWEFWDQVLISILLSYPAT